MQNSAHLAFSYTNVLLALSNTCRHTGCITEWIWFALSFFAYKKQR